MGNIPRSRCSQVKKKKKKSQDIQMNKTLQKSSKNRSTKLLEQSEVEYKISILLMFTEIKGSEKRSKNKVIIFF